VTTFVCHCQCHLPMGFTLEEGQTPPPGMRPCDDCAEAHRVAARPRSGAALVLAQQEQHEARIVLLEAHVENLIERVYALEQRLGDPAAAEDDGEGPCLALFYDGSPAFTGPHEPHLFTYGQNGVYVGNCGGRQ
jgi:hypothetical protein